MIFSYDWLKDCIKGKLPKPEKLAELLAMNVFEVEQVKKIKRDYALDIDILPNRGSDCLSHIGLAREIAAVTDLKLVIPEFKLKEDKEIKDRKLINVEVQDKNDCSRYTARVITSVKVGSSPKWIQERLKICGLRPINNIVDSVNYVMLETGQPLHAFDFDKISGFAEKKKIIVRRARGAERITTLEEEKYILENVILIIADLEGPLAIAGIKGGMRAEIGAGTKTIVLESANFNSKVIRRASRILGLKTDASWRFEHKIDPNLAGEASNQAAFLIQEIAGGKVGSGLVDFYPKKALPKKIKLDLNYVEKLLGIKISAKEIKNILNKLGFKITKVIPPQIIVEVPTFRLDVSLPEDLIEEIGRIYGYQKVPIVFPVASLIPPKRNFKIFWEDSVKNILKELGFSEVYNYSFIGDKETEVFKYKNQEIIEVENPVSREQKYLRPSLIPNLLKNVRSNFRYFDEIKIFELGKIFPKKQGKEKTMLTGLIARKQEGDDFYRLKGIIDSLLNRLGISNIWYDSYQPTPQESKSLIWQSKKCAEIKIDHDEIGFLGEISPKILKDLNIIGKVVLFNLDFEKLAKLCSEEHEYRPISQYPSAVRDLAVLVPREVKVVDVLNQINIAGGSLIRDVDIFDIYEGAEIPERKKNLAFHIIYQAEDRTLKAKEIDEMQNKIIKLLEKNPRWEVRK